VEADMPTKLHAHIHSEYIWPGAEMLSYKRSNDLDFSFQYNSSCGR